MQVPFRMLYMVIVWSAVNAYQVIKIVERIIFPENTLNAIVTGDFIFSGDTDERYIIIPGLFD